VKARRHVKQDNGNQQVVGMGPLGNETCCCFPFVTCWEAVPGGGRRAAFDVKDGAWATNGGCRNSLKQGRNWDAAIQRGAYLDQGDVRVGLLVRVLS